MEEQAKRQFAAVATTVAGIAYFLAFAQPLPKVFRLEPVWSQPVAVVVPAAGTVTDPARPPRSFSIGRYFGYFDDSSGITQAAELSYGISLTDAGYAAYDRVPDAITWRDPRGSVQAVTPIAGYPFMAGGRRFLIASNQSTVFEIDGSGAVAWKRDFPSILTAFDACPSLALFGTLDGRLFGISPSGEEVMTFSPGGSRIEGIYGCAVSPDGRTLGAITGLDKQRLVVLERRDAAYRVAWHRWLDAEYRRPVAMSFTDSGKQLFFESPRGIGIYSVARRTEDLLVIEENRGLGRTLAGRDVLLALEGSGRSSLVVASLSGRRLFTFGFGAEEATFSSHGGSLFIALRRPEGSSLMRLDFGED
jgi:hypothetical protein